MPQGEEQSDAWGSAAGTAEATINDEWRPDAVVLDDRAGSSYVRDAR